MKPIFYPVCAVAGGCLAAGLAYVSGDRPASGAAVSGPAVMVAGVYGAPGDGNVALETAIRTILVNADIPVSDTLEGCNVAVSAEVSRFASVGAEQLSIVWKVIDADGLPLGDVSQVNTVEPGSLDIAWGTDASLAARGARDGIVAIMRRPRAGCS